MKAARITIFLSLLVYNSSYAAQAQTEAAQAPFALTIRADKGEIYKSGNSILVDIELTNLLKRPQRFGFSVGVSGEPYNVVVTRPDGEHVFRTEYGQLVYDSRNGKIDHFPPPQDVISRSELLQPDGHVQDSLLISKLYDMTRPGKYLVFIERRTAAEFDSKTVRSNSVEITVTE